MKDINAKQCSRKAQRFEILIAPRAGMGVRTMRHVMVFFGSLLCLGALLAILPLEATAQDDSRPRLVFLEPLTSDQRYLVTLQPDDNGAATRSLSVVVENQSDFEGSLEASFVPEQAIKLSTNSGDGQIKPYGVAQFEITLTLEKLEEKRRFDGTLVVTASQTTLSSSSPLAATIPLTLEVQSDSPDWTTAKAEPVEVQLLVTHGWPALIDSQRSADVALGLGLGLAFLWLIWYTFQRFSEWFRQNERDSRWPWIMAGIAIAVLLFILGKYWNEPGRPFGAFWTIVTTLLAVGTAYQMWSPDRGSTTKRKPLTSRLVPWTHWLAPTAAGLSLIVAVTSQSDADHFVWISQLKGQTQQVRLYGVEPDQLATSAAGNNFTTLVSSSSGETAYASLVAPDSPIPCPTPPSSQNAVSDCTSAKMTLEGPSGVGSFEGSLKIQPTVEDALALPLTAVVRDWWIWPLLAVLLGGWIGWLINNKYDQHRSKKLVKTQLTSIQDHYTDAGQEVRSMSPLPSFRHLFACPNLQEKIANCKEDLLSSPDSAGPNYTPRNECCAEVIKSFVDASASNPDHIKAEKDEQRRQEACINLTNPNCLQTKLAALSSELKAAATKEELDKVANKTIDLQNMVAAWPELCRVATDLRIRRISVATYLDTKIPLFEGIKPSKIQPLLLRAHDLLNYRIRPADQNPDEPESPRYPWAFKSAADVTKRISDINDLTLLLAQLQHVLNVHEDVRAHFRSVPETRTELDPSRTLLAHIAGVRDGDTLQNLLELLSADLDKILDILPSEIPLLELVNHFILGQSHSAQDQVIVHVIQDRSLNPEVIGVLKNFQEGARTPEEDRVFLNIVEGNLQLSETSVGIPPYSLIASAAGIPGASPVTLVRLATASELLGQIRVTDAIVSGAAIMLLAITYLLTVYKDEAFGSWLQYLTLVTGAAAIGIVVNQAFLPWTRSNKLPAGDTDKAAPESK